MDESRLTACPGCGVRLPDTEFPARRRANASAACWRLYTDMTGFEAEHLPQLGQFHQLTVDAYGAQHAGDPTPPISTAFALIGLHLALDEQMPGIAVRAAHQYLSGRFRTWPTFNAPSDAWQLTILDVSRAVTPAAHAELVQAWAAAAWAGWRNEHARVQAWASEVLPHEVRGRLRSA